MEPIWEYVKQTTSKNNTTKHSLKMKNGQLVANLEDELKCWRETIEDQFYKKDVEANISITTAP